MAEILKQINVLVHEYNNGNIEEERYYKMLEVYADALLDATK